MKRILIFVLLTVFVSCQKKDVAPRLPTNNGLYKTWRLTQIVQGNKSVETTSYNFTVTFPRDGSFTGNAPKNSLAPCCSPVAFEGTNVAIRFIWGTPAPNCASVHCLLSPLSGGVTWQITTLNDTSLILVGGNTLLEFEAQP